MAIQRTSPKTDSTPAQSSPIIKRQPPQNSNSALASGSVKFVKSSGPMKNRLIVAVTGEDHSGKNHMAFTAPGPIYVHSFDPGIEGVIEKFHNKKDIYVATYELDIQPGEGSAQEVADSADKLWNNFISNYRDGLASCGQGTTVVDTDTEAHELIRLARFGRLANVMPHHYGPVNAEFRDFLREGWNRNGNIFFLSKYVDEWENYTDSQGKEKGRKTGGKVRKGFSDLPFHVHVYGICERTDIEGGGSDFKFTLLDCRQSPQCNGLIIDNDYDTLSSMVLAEYVGK